METLEREDINQQQLKLEVESRNKRTLSSTRDTTDGRKIVATESAKKFEA